MDRISAWELADDRQERYAVQLADEYLFRINDYTDDIG